MNEGEESERTLAMQPKCGSEGMGNLSASKSGVGLEEEARERAAREAARAARVSVLAWRRRRRSSLPEVSPSSFCE